MAYNQEQFLSSLSQLATCVLQDKSNFAWVNPLIQAALAPYDGYDYSTEKRVQLVALVEAIEVWVNITQGQKIHDAATDGITQLEHFLKNPQETQIDPAEPIDNEHVEVVVYLGPSRVHELKQRARDNGRELEQELIELSEEVTKAAGRIIDGES